MLWYKFWLETRWRFFIGMMVLVASATGIVLTHPLVMKSLQQAPKLGGQIGKALDQAVQLNLTYQGYAWGQWFSKNFPDTWAIFAVILAVGGLRHENLFALSLPVTRTRWLTLRAGLIAAELAALAYLPSLLIPLLSPVIGQSVSLGDTLLYCTATAVAGLWVVAFTVLLATVFQGWWQPITISLLVYTGLSILDGLVAGSRPFNPHAIMSARSFFENGAFPWAGVLLCLALAAGMLYLSARLIERRDF